MVIREPSCTDDGLYHMNCRQCDHVDDVVIPALGHQPGEAEEIDRVEASCTEAGHSESVVYCSICGKELDGP